MSHGVRSRVPELAAVGRVLRYFTAKGFALHISVHLLLVAYGLAMGTFHAVVGSSHPPGARLVPYLEAACGLCAPAISSARDSTPTHLLLW